MSLRSKIKQFCNQKTSLVISTITLLSLCLLFLNSSQIFDTNQSHQNSLTLRILSDNNFLLTNNPPSPPQPVPFKPPTNIIGPGPKAKIRPMPIKADYNPTNSANYEKCCKGIDMSQWYLEENLTEKDAELTNSFNGALYFIQELIRDQRYGNMIRSIYKSLHLYLPSFVFMVISFGFVIFLSTEKCYRACKQKSSKSANTSMGKKDQSVQNVSSIIDSNNMGGIDDLRKIRSQTLFKSGTEANSNMNILNSIFIAITV